jgi:phenylpropionate dioxygenase-like ring-hydroxylating dioxygenase large terminal subunit
MNIENNGPLATYACIRNCWYMIGASADFPAGKLTGHVVAGKPIVAWRAKQGAVVAYDDRCAHKRFPLSKGRLMDDGTLECAYHGLRYDMTGKCVMIPSHPTGPISPKAVVRPFPIIEQDGIVWLWPGDLAAAETRKPPRLPEIGSEEWCTEIIGPMDVPANYLLLIENLLDITHFYPLHDGNIGDVANSRIPVDLEEGEVDGNRYAMTIRKVSRYAQPPYLVDWFHYDVVDRHHTHCMMSPGVTRVVMRNAPAGELRADGEQRYFPGRLDADSNERGYVLVHAHTPVDALRHKWWVLVNAPARHMSKGDPNKQTAKRIAEMFPAVIAEDHFALEQQQKMFSYADDGYQEVFLKPDIAIRRARAIFHDLLREEQQELARSHAAE